jgi:hypothetical protein
MGNIRINWFGGQKVVSVLVEELGVFYCCMLERQCGLRILVLEDI